MTAQVLKDFYTEMKELHSENRILAFLTPADGFNAALVVGTFSTLFVLALAVLHAFGLIPASSVISTPLLQSAAPLMAMGTVALAIFFTGLYGSNKYAKAEI